MPAVREITSMLPKLVRPCPYLDRLDSVVANGFCRMCRREVHDLTAMSESARDAFLASCGEDTCISLTAYVRPAVAAAAIAASAAVLAVPAHAGDRAKAAAHGDRGHARHHAGIPVAPLIAVVTAGAPVLMETPPATPVDPSAATAATKI